jgi:hypothetical protein
MKQYVRSLNVCLETFEPKVRAELQNKEESAGVLLSSADQIKLCWRIQWRHVEHVGIKLHPFEAWTSF